MRNHLKRILFLSLLACMGMVMPVHASDTVSSKIQVSVEGNSSPVTVGLFQGQNLVSSVSVSSNGVGILETKAYSDVAEESYTIKLVGSNPIDTTQYNLKVYVIYDGDRLVSESILYKSGETSKLDMCKFKAPEEKKETPKPKPTVKPKKPKKKSTPKTVTTIKKSTSSKTSKPKNGLVKIIDELVPKASKLINGVLAPGTGIASVGIVFLLLSIILFGAGIRVFRKGTKVRGD